MTRARRLSRAAAEDEVAVDAAFVATDRGYRGWYWSVTLALIDPGRTSD